MRTKAFFIRNLKELLRDPLSYIFCIGFPIVLLIVMSILNKSIPGEGNPAFAINYLGAGMVIFGHLFTMLFGALSLARDRSKAFLIRMYSSPMKPIDYIAGYVLSLETIALFQSLITLIGTYIISVIVNVELQIGALLLTLLVSIASGTLFILIGLLFGTIFNEKAAPGMCSAIISIGSFLGGFWMDIDAIGGTLLTISKCFPFYYCMSTVKGALNLDFCFSGFGLSMIVVLVLIIAFGALNVIIFRRKMRADVK